jgi:hypothetical protein
MEATGKEACRCHFGSQQPTKVIPFWIEGLTGDCLGLVRVKKRAFGNKQDLHIERNKDRTKAKGEDGMEYEVEYEDEDEWGSRGRWGSWLVVIKR